MIRSTKRKLLKAKLALQATLYKILDINRKKKKLAHIKLSAEKRQAIQSELNLLNKVAKQQAKLIRLYESKLSKRDSA